MILSILIPTTPDREEFLSELLSELYYQVDNLSIRDSQNYWKFIEINTDKREKPVSIGEKRNRLLQEAAGKFICFIDDDDMVSMDYLPTIMNAINFDQPLYDCLSLRGEMTTDGKDPQIFEHSLKYSEWKDNGNGYPRVRYERYPNHLNIIRADVAKQFKFPEINHGEDQHWSRLLHESGLLKNELYIDKIMYYYKYRTNK